MDQLNKKAFLGFSQLFITLAILLFVPGWTVDYWQAWVFLATFFLGALAITIYLAKKDVKLLERRLSAGPAAEKEKSQKTIQVLAQISFLAIIVFPAIDHRFGWSAVPAAIVFAGNIFIIAGYLIVFLVFKENTFTSATIEVADGQSVISTGPYALVRHPMYMGALVLLLGIPIALGSWWGMLAVIPITLVLAWRLRDEEKFLSKNLAGYPAYQEKVKYRLIPFIW
jgi:protein-S-isoprenylcysteine O-methyltransferase Ste14